MGKAVSTLRSHVEALEKARRFAVKVREKCRVFGLEVIGVYLVCSRARGDYLIDSDIDIVVVVKDVKNLNMIKRLELFKDLLESRIDLRVYDVEEWISNESFG